MSEDNKGFEVFEINAKRNKESGEYEIDARFEADERTQLFADFAHQLLKKHNAPNFFTFECTTSEHLRMSITVQRMAWDADTPAKKLATLTSQVQKLQARLDSILSHNPNAEPRIREWTEADERAAYPERFGLPHHGSKEAR